MNLHNNISEKMQVSITCVQVYGMHSAFKVTGGSDVNMQPMSQFSGRVMSFSIWHEHWSIHLCILSTLLFEIHCFITVKLGTAN